MFLYWLPYIEESMFQLHVCYFKATFSDHTLQQMYGRCFVCSVFVTHGMQRHCFGIVCLFVWIILDLELILSSTNSGMALGWPFMELCRIVFFHFCLHWHWCPSSSFYCIQWIWTKIAENTRVRITPSWFFVGYPVWMFHLVLSGVHLLTGNVSPKCCIILVWLFM